MTNEKLADYHVQLMAGALAGLCTNKDFNYDGSIDQYVQIANDADQIATECLDWISKVGSFESMADLDVGI